MEGRCEGEPPTREIVVATEEELRRGMEPVGVKPTDRAGALAHFQERLGRHVERARYEAYIDGLIAKLLLDAPVDGEVWVCQSRYRGPMAGHEGLGLVREGVVLRYETIVRY
jgi:hypothetical protein